MDFVLSRQTIGSWRTHEASRKRSQRQARLKGAAEVLLGVWALVNLFLIAGLVWIPLTLKFVDWVNY